jgi:hypothetical protein
VSLKFIEQFGELEWFEEQPSGAKKAAKKLNTGGAIDEKDASRAEADTAREKVAVSVSVPAKPALILQSLQRD